MTTLVKEIRQCQVCGERNEYERVASTNRLGTPDLDTRPAEMERSTIPFWIQSCPACGYCAPQVSDGPAQAGEIVHSDT